MFEKRKVWVGLGIALMTSTALGTTGAAATETGKGQVGAEPFSSGENNAFIADAASWRVAQHARSQGGERGKPGEGGERAKSGEGGEGGEGGERGAAAKLTRSDAAYLTQLALIRGHLNVGVELYRVGDRKAAATHMKHPDDELYAALKPALAKRRAPGFDKELHRLAERVEKNAPPAEVDAAYNALLAAIAKAEAAVAKPTAQQIGEVINNLVRTTANEYRAAVADGQVAEPHEYQDALGFVRTAEDWLQKLEASRANPSVVAEIRNQIALIKPAWTGVVPPKTAAMDPSKIYGAAARIEIATLALKP
jgi:hypothetical protein